MKGTFDENMHPCKGCEDFIPPNDCKSKGGCAVQSELIEVLNDIRGEIDFHSTTFLNGERYIEKNYALDIIDKYLESVSK